jgi:hypothetical protein
MVKLKREMAGVTIEVKHKESVYEWSNYRNTFQVKVSSKNGEKYDLFDKYSTEKQLDVTEDLFQVILLYLYEACFMNSEAYDNFEEWCYDYGYNENDDDDKIIYHESIERGNKLNDIVNEEWKDIIETYVVMANAK